MWNYDFTFIRLPDKNFDLGHVNLCPAPSRDQWQYVLVAESWTRLLHIFQISVRMVYTLVYTLAYTRVLQRNKVLIDDKITPLM